MFVFDMKHIKFIGSNIFIFINVELHSCKLNKFFFFTKKKSFYIIVLYNHIRNTKLIRII